MPLVMTDTTDIGLKTSKDWEYSDLQIDLKEVTGLRFAVYDNAPDLTHMFEKNRYRGELQVYTTDSTKSTYKMFSYFSNYKSYKNNKWKQEKDKYKDWYVNEVETAKVLNEEYGVDGAVAHCNLKVKKEHATSGFGKYDVPKYAMHMVHNKDGIFVQVHIGDEEPFPIMLTETSRINGNAKLYYRKVAMSWQD
jgi:hypothetical protein